MKTFHSLSGKISVAYEEKLSDPIDEKIPAGNHTVIIQLQSLLVAAVVWIISSRLKRTASGRQMRLNLDPMRYN